MLSSFATSAQMTSNSDEIFSLAAKSNKPVFLVFSGSDWCQQCIRFDKNILSDSVFQTFAGKHFTLYKADFPQRKKLEETIITQNEALAETYNPEGLFPRILLVSPDKKVINVFNYNQQTVEEFIAELNSFL